jgi:hypothetical protein
MEQKEYSKLASSEQQKEDWMNSKWRPAMGWMYMGVCLFDFVLAPILWSLVQALYKGGVNVQWQPLTLQGAGLFHIAMGAVLGLAAYGRTQEKLGGANNGGITLPSNVGTTYTPPAPAAQPGGFGAPASFNGNTGFGAPTVGSPNMSSGGWQQPDQNQGWGTTPIATGRMSPKTGRLLVTAPVNEPEFDINGEPVFKGDPEAKG